MRLFIFHTKMIIDEYNAAFRDSEIVDRTWRPGTRNIWWKKEEVTRVKILGASVAGVLVDPEDIIPPYRAIFNCPVKLVDKDKVESLRSDLFSKTKSTRFWVVPESLAFLQDEELEERPHFRRKIRADKII